MTCLRVKKEARDLESVEEGEGDWRCGGKIRSCSSHRSLQAVAGKEIVLSECDGKALGIFKKT